jgi:hypothetical protein
MSKHNEKKIWMIRKEGDSNGYVRTSDSKLLNIHYYANINNTSEIVDFNITRNDARVLAKRILDCLEDTK